jgi:hypothetical protein
MMLATVLSGKAVISQGAAPRFDVEEKTIAQIQQAIRQQASHDTGRR